LARDLPDPLFIQYDLRGTLQNQEAAMVKAIVEYPSDVLTQETEDQLVAQFLAQFRVDPPVLTEGAISVTADEHEVDVSGDFDRDVWDRSEPHYVPGVRVTYYVPFTGDPDYFKCQPSTHSFNPPRADIVGHDLEFRYDRADGNVAATKTAFESELVKVRQHLGWVANDIAAFNASLPAKIASKVQDRRARLERTKGELQSLGVLVRQTTRARATSPGAPTGASRAVVPSAATYDVSLSFAGEERDYVERVAELLKQKGVSVFYDKFEKATLWGKNLIDYLADIYQHRSRFVVMFISKHYVAKAFPTHERQHAQARGLVVRDEYILPARFDDTEVPGLAPTISYADLRKVSPDELVGLILVKLGRRGGTA